MDLGLRGRTAFVAAASRGLGYATADVLATEGADVGICARDSDAVDAAATSLRRHGTRIVARTADVTDLAALTAAIDACADATSSLDILVVNAGGPPPGGFEKTGDDLWQKGFELTVMSAVHMIRHALPLLRRSDAASIVLISSSSVVQPIGGLMLSTSLRRALSGLVATLAVELAPHVRINTVLPRLAKTERAVDLARAGAAAGQSVEGVMAATAATIPLRRYGEPEEVGRLVAFLASPAAAYITGQEILIDGGKLSMPL